MAASNLSAVRPWSPNSEELHFAVMELGVAKVYQGSLVGTETSGGNAGYLMPYNASSASTTMILRGRAKRTVDNSTGAVGALSVEVDLVKPVKVFYLDNVNSVNAFAKTDRGKDAYAESDDEAGKTSSGLSKIGRLWDLGTSAENSSGMVAVEVV